MIVGSGATIIYIGHARKGDATLKKLFEQHTKGNGNRFVRECLSGRQHVMYRYEVLDGVSNPASMEARHLDPYKGKTGGELPPGNMRNETLAAWTSRVGTNLRNWI